MSLVRSLFALALGLSLASSAFAQPAPFTVVVMDPLAAPLSCPCVKGYAQRDYEKLAKHLEKQLGRPVKVHFSESLVNALQKKSEGKADLVIGKESVIRHESKSTKLSLVPVASLTGKDGKTTMTGMFVVAAADPALALGDLKGYRMIFGPADADEKHSAALGILRDLEVAPPKKLETCASCSDGATTVIDLAKQGAKVTTVISSYAQPLLEGCGTIKKGDLRVVGETDPVPFVVAFVNESLSTADRATVQQALMQVGADADLRNALETKGGFVPFANGKKK
jgi:ABC-type phosphate/phosphonate transport system substrate-binding protein